MQMRKKAKNWNKCWSYCCVLCSVHGPGKILAENFQEKGEKAKNAEKRCFYNVKRRKTTHADAKKCEKWEQMYSAQFFAFFSASACVIFAFYIIKIRFFFAFFAFFAFFLKVFGHDFSWYCVLCTAQEKYWPKLLGKMLKMRKMQKNIVFIR